MVTQAEQVTGLIPNHCSSCQNVIKQDNKSESSVAGVCCVFEIIHFQIPAHTRVCAGLETAVIGPYMRLETSKHGQCKPYYLKQT